MLIAAALGGLLDWLGSAFGPKLRGSSPTPSDSEAPEALRQMRPATTACQLVKAVQGSGLKFLTRRCSSRFLWSGRLRVTRKCTALSRLGLC